MSSGRDRWIPRYFVLFFVVVAVLDGLFVYLAVSTQTGVVTERTYDKGLRYNDTIAAAEAQAARGWKGTVALEGTRLVFTLRDAQDKPLEGAVVTAHVVRPTQEGHDVALPLQEEQGGRYAQALNLPLKGQWDVRIAALWDNQPYQQHTRLNLP